MPPDFSPDPDAARSGLWRMPWPLGLVGWFAPDEGSDPVAHLRTQLFVLFSLLVSANGAVFSALHALHHRPGASWTVVGVLSAMSVASLAFPFALRGGLPAAVLVPAFVGFFQGAVVAVAWFDGGLASGAGFWLAFTPLVATFVGGTRLGWTAAAVSVGAGVALFAAGAAGYPFSASISAEHAPLHYVLNFGCAAGLTAAFAALYEGPMIRGLGRLASQLGHANEALRVELAERQRAQADSRAKDVLLANLSHEFRTPLTAVLSGAEVLRLDAPADDRPVLDAMSRGARRLLDTLDGVLDLSRIDRAGPLVRQSVEVGPLVQAVVAPFATAATARGLEVRLRIEPAYAAADAAALARAVRALVDNAVRFTEAGGVTVSVGRADGAVAVTVRDTGIGMGAEAVARAAEPFRQASEGHARTHEGLGIGLTLATRLVEAMGGTLAIESAVGVGTAVRLRVPAAEPPLAVRAGGDGERRWTAEPVVAARRPAAVRTCQDSNLEPST